MSTDLAIALSALAVVVFVGWWFITGLRDGISVLRERVSECQKNRWLDIEAALTTRELLNTLAKESGYELRKPDTSHKWVKAGNPAAEKGE